MNIHRPTNFNRMANCSVSETMTTASCVDIDSVAFFCWHSTRQYAEKLDWPLWFDPIIKVKTWQKKRTFSLTRRQQSDDQQKWCNGYAMWLVHCLGILKKRKREKTHMTSNSILSKMAKYKQIIGNRYWPIGMDYGIYLFVENRFHSNEWIDSQRMNIRSMKMKWNITTKHKTRNCCYLFGFLFFGVNSCECQ